ncbi:hypothetical protein, partial [Glutamicibacter arilaitensis]|uniref:hypothetical protein n=1 Tax=Glutamicibacter arilaitensis TaxID=256701 RepID=UPI003FD3E208
MGIRPTLEEQLTVPKTRSSELNYEANLYTAISKPEHAIFNFRDVQFESAQLDTAAFVTCNEWKVCATDFHKEHMLEQFLPRTDSAYEVRCQAVPEAVRFIRRVSPDCKLVLHDVEFV